MATENLLLGQHIGSLRMVRFGSAADTTEPSEEVLEIETKAGRLFHLSPDSRSRTITLASGPAIPGAPPAAAQEVAAVPGDPARYWRDLSEFLSGAFDGRPVVEAIQPVLTPEATPGDPPPASPEGSAANEPAGGGPAPAHAATGWRLRLSTGYVITFSWGQAGLTLAGDYSSRGSGPTCGA